MMRVKRKPKKRTIRYDRLVLLILLAILLVFLLALLIHLAIQSLRNPFRDLGYQTQTISIIEQLNKEEKEELASQEYRKDIEELILHPEFQSQNYLNYKQQLNIIENPELEVVVKSVNLNLEYSRYIELYRNIFTSDNYYIVDLYDRYSAYYQQNYQDQNSQDVIRDVVASVNTNVDRDYYSWTEVADTNLNEQVLVNKYYYLQEGYRPNHLEDLPIEYGYNAKLQKDAKDAFIQMCNDAQKQGFYLYANSSYRDYMEQANLYSEYSLDNGSGYADQFSARAGHSEHQTGYVVDVVSKAEDSIMDSFEFTKEYQWMKENAYRYGFIQHYQKGLEKYTGYQAESWHYRYVGKDIAKYLQENAISFDEYYAYYIKRR